ncbi:MAG: DNA-processing protein DprA [Dongiaceae bacterium]
MTSSPTTFDETERLDRLRLARADTVGPASYRQLLERFGAAGPALDALPDLARRAGGKANLRIPSRRDAAREFAAVRALGGGIVIEGEAAYPACLAAIPDPPPLLTWRGDLSLLEAPAIAIVGARNASAGGRRIAETLARELGEAGFVIVSGLARGIDTAAHRGALATGTIAVFAGGLDVVYPSENEALASEIAAGGLLLAELAPGTQPLARNFPRRNRIVSGLALGAIVVEAAIKSGSLTTARLALEQGREVLAVPGSPLDQRCRGTNRLLREGAVLVEETVDVIEAIGPLAALRPRPKRPSTLAQTTPPPPQPIDIPQEIMAATLLERLGASPVPVDELIRQCSFSAPVVRTMLLELELAGRLERHPGDAVSMLPA